MILVFFNNLKNYDSRIIVSEYMKYDTDRRIEAIAQTYEKYLSILLEILDLLIVLHLWHHL